MTKLETRQYHRDRIIHAWYPSVDPLWHQTAEDGSDVRVYPMREKFVLLAFLGTAGKPAQHVIYRRLEDAQRVAEEIIGGRAAHAERKASERAARQAFRTTLQVGSVLTSSWGYDQTNIDFYEVVGVSPSRQSVTIRPIAQRSVPDQWMQGTCWPLAGEYTGPESTHRVGEGESVKVRDWGVWARPWKGELRRWTAYA